MGKISITIRCAKCYAVETHTIYEYAALKTTCGCNGPYRVLVRTPLADDPETEKSGEAKGD